MWSQSEQAEERPACPPIDNRARLIAARLKMEEALCLLDEFSASAAAASLDLAMHQLDRELASLGQDLP